MAEPVTKADVIDAIGELGEAMGAFSERLDGRELELILRADGTLSLMGASSPANESFDEMERFDSIAELMLFLEMAEVLV